TATQQEPDPELSTDKSTQPTSSIQPQSTEGSSTPKEKEVDKSKESVTVRIAGP
ncbi:hypothetical protein XELAEV_180461522mg, partial [Xenopus laevis]